MDASLNDASYTREAIVGLMRFCQKYGMHLLRSDPPGSAPQRRADSRQRRSVCSEHLRRSGRGARAVHIGLVVRYGALHCARSFARGLRALQGLCWRRLAHRSLPFDQPATLPSAGPDQSIYLVWISI